MESMGERRSFKFCCYLTGNKGVIPILKIKALRKCLPQTLFTAPHNQGPPVVPRFETCYPASRGCVFAIWDGVRKVASADNRSIFYRACAKFVTRFASNWFVKSARVSRESNLRKLLANKSPRAFVLFFCFAPSGFKYFSRKRSADRLWSSIFFSWQTRTTI